MSISAYFARWKRIFHDTRGQISIGSWLFYATSGLIVLAIPVTVVLLRTNQEQITTASFSPISFSSPPTMSVDPGTMPVQKGQTISIKTVATNSNWNMLFFSPQYPTVMHPFQKHIMTIVAQGASVPDSYFTAQESGYIMGVSFQLQGAYGEFRSGDLMCTWNGEMYLYKKKTVNPIVEFVDKNAKYEGEWDKLTTCQNNSLKRLDVQ